MDVLPPRPKLKRLADYRPPDWLVPSARFRFELDAARTLVHARLEVRRNGDHRRSLHLDGEELELLSLKVDGQARPIPHAATDGLELEIAADAAIVETVVAIHPRDNRRLMGLYASGGNLCTQCEAEGFRRISYWPDRPDILSTFSVRLEADAEDYPVLLSNGNMVAHGPLADGKHFAEWHDPFPKPSYLFALVAGRLEALRDSFTTRSGRRVDLAIWVARGDVPRTRHAMQSLKQAMAWDEKHYGREYDLDTFNIVAVHDFNFGAMENKGLNIFNAKYILADPDTATDWDFDAIAAVVAHEYFHNWSGNRVTCRDWFQLCLKEGFTVYRDQCFSESLGSPDVRRIEAVRALQASQFPEDDGPLAHPVRPDTYMEISNFYTATVYNKGAELIRMIARILGPERFRAGADRYFADNDGTAATVEDFLAAMAAQGLDTQLFGRWYEQPGTPWLDVDVGHDRRRGAALVHVSQRNPKAGDPAPPLPIPLSFALFAADGRKLAQREELLTRARQTFVVENISRPPVVSMNRGFAAPVRLRPSTSRTDLALLATYEDDAFARYSAMQQLMLSALVDSAASGMAVGHEDVIAVISAAIADWRADPDADLAMLAEKILPPSEGLIGDQMALVDPEAVHLAREALRRALLDALGPALREMWENCVTDGADLSPSAKGKRRLRGILLSLLMARDDPGAAALAWEQFATATSMTDRMSALTALANSSAPERSLALSTYMDRYRHVPEAMDKWFLVQAMSIRPDTLEVVKSLARHPLYDAHNPNRLRSLVLGFGGNPIRFHDRDGYVFLVDQVLAADGFNPQAATRLVQPLVRWQRMAKPWSEQMRAALETIAQSPRLSRDMTEVVTNALK